jgi:hypothetical protein
MSRDERIRFPTVKYDIPGKEEVASSAHQETLGSVMHQNITSNEVGMVNLRSAVNFPLLAFHKHATLFCVLHCFISGHISLT